MRYIKAFAFVFVALFVLFIGSIWAIRIFVTNPSLGPSYAQKTPHLVNADNLFSLVNSWRIQNGLKPFIKDKNLCQYASVRAAQIQTDFSHDKFLSVKCSGSVCGENLSRNISYESSILAAWVRSPEHLANLKYPYVYSCISCVGTYCADEFRSY